MIRFVTFTALMLFILTCHAVTIETKNKPSEQFNYLKFDGNYLLSTHDIKLAVRKPAGFELIKPMSHQAVFNDHPFNVSLAAFVKGKMILAVHAEKVTDNSGFLDYSYMKPTELNGIKFYLKARCAQLTPDDVAGAADLRYFELNGYDFSPTIYLTQFFKNSADGNSEYVVTYGEQVSSCAESVITEDFKARFNTKLTQVIDLTKID